MSKGELAIKGERVSVERLTKAFDNDVVAVNNVSFEVHPGETVCLLGPSGCGKTTLLRCIAGLERPDAGEVVVGKRTLSGDGAFVPPERRHIGMVFQEWALFPHMSVKDNVTYGLSRAQRNSNEWKELLELVGLTGLEKRRPDQLSGGQQQRVALARALAPDPSLLLFDEPFSNLDAERRRRMRVEVAALLNRLNVSAIFVTHDQEEAFTMGQRVAVMRDGVIEQIDQPQALYEQPVSAWIAGFVGDANLVRGLASGAKAETAIGTIPLAELHHGDVEVLLRTEALSLRPGSNGTVSVTEFYGHDVVHRVAVHDGTELKVRTHPSAAVQSGSAIDVSYSGGPTRAWPATTPSGPTG